MTDSPATTIMQMIMNFICIHFFSYKVFTEQGKKKQQSKKDKITLIKQNNDSAIWTR